MIKALFSRATGLSLTGLVAGGFLVLYFPGQLSPIPFFTGAAWKIDSLQDSLRETEAALAQTEQYLRAETQARQEANSRVFEAEREAQEALVERDAARREAQEARARVVTRTVEVIRDADPVWRDAVVPDTVRLARLRGWCEREPARVDSDLCRDPAATLGLSGPPPDGLPPAAGGD